MSSVIFVVPSEYVQTFRDKEGCLLFIFKYPVPAEFTFGFNDKDKKDFQEFYDNHVAGHDRDTDNSIIGCEKLPKVATQFCSTSFSTDVFVRNKCLTHGESNYPAGADGCLLCLFESCNNWTKVSVSRS